MTTVNAHLEAEIARAKKQAAERISKLKREAAAEQRRIDSKVVDLLREQNGPLYDRLAAEAVDALAAARAHRSKSARGGAAGAQPSHLSSQLDAVGGPFTGSD